MKNKKRVLALMLAGVLTLGCFPTTVGAVNNAYDGTKPADGTTKKQPFLAGTGGSTNFRIPGLVTLNDGTLVASSDARWNGGGDGGGLDTIVSRSTDNGKTWSYTFANYLGDNGNVHNNGSTAFIDPALTTDGGTVYMAADLYPAGTALNSASYAPKTGHTGYDSQHRLVLAKATDSVTAASDTAQRMNAAFTYYLEKNPDENATSYYLLKDASGNTVSGYTVDAYFNITGNGVNTNLFCGDSPYFPYPTDFIYVTKSTDGGETWSEPTLLDVKKASEQSLLVGPGRGIVISTGEHKGRIVFTCYEFTNGDKNSAAIYSDDNGVTWHRGASAKNFSSEAVVTEADGKLYMFVRRENVYYVSNDGGETWSDPQAMGISYNATCQLTATTYSEKINGKTAIFFACPSNTSSRAAGKIYVGLVQDDGSIDWAYNYSINGSAYYAYSCISEMANGNIGLLYESNGTAITFKEIALKDIVGSASVGSVWLTDEDGNVISSDSMKSSQTKTYAVNGVAEGTSVEVTSSDESAVTAVYENGKLKVTSGQVEGLKQATVTVHAGSYVRILKLNISDTENYKVVELNMGGTKSYTDTTGNYSSTDTSALDKNVAKVTMTGEDPQAPEVKTVAVKATAIATFNGAELDLDDCEYTFEATGTDNRYKVKATTADGQTVYLGTRAAGSNNVPSSTTETSITVAKHNTDSLFTLTDNRTGSVGNILWFWSTDTSKLYFDRNSSVADNCYFELYKKSASAPEDSAVHGYQKVTALDEIQGGEKYLIVTKADANGNKYVVVPSAAVMANRYEHVGKLKTNTEGTPGSTQITFEGTGEGTTSVTIGAVTYYVVVKNEVQKVELKVGEKFLAPGKLMQQESGQEIVSLAANGDQPPYVKNTEIVSGKEYLIGQSSYVLVNSQSTASGTPTGLAMKAADLESDDQSAYMWTVKAVDGGYTIQDVNGKYLSFNGSNVGLSDTAQTLTVGNGASDGFGISYGGQYLNNYGRSNTKVAGYSANDNDWYLFAPETGYFVTAEKAGTTTVVIGGVTYEIVVTETVTECKHENTERVGVKDPTCTEPGSTGKLVCKDCNETLEEATEIAATGHSLSLIHI